MPAARPHGRIAPAATHQPSMTTPTIRLLTAADAAAFQRLRLAALLDTPASFASSHDEEKDTPLEDVARRLVPRPGHGVLGAFDGETLVGMAGLGTDGRAKFVHKGVIWGMYVAPQARGQGLARELMIALIALARATPGFAKLDLVADSMNVAAIALYESLGFVVWGREQDAMRFDGESRDDLHMALHLGAAVG
jgi:RimJ/RimL family protein N-acetyltransferase